MLREILIRLSQKTGFDLDAQRENLVDLANQGAKEIYESVDLPNSLWEVVVRVAPNKQISLPGFVGQLRNMRELESEIRHELVDMRPRYSYNPWKYCWRHWRLKGVSAIHTDITSEAPLQFFADTAENITISVSGKTSTANVAVDNVLMDIIPKDGTLPFQEIRTISSSQPRISDIIIRDLDGKELAVLYNDQPKTRYVIVDVSQFPFSTCEDGKMCMEVLYKKRFIPMFDDSDEFICDGYEDAIFYKSMEIWTADQEGKEQRAVMAATKVAQLLANKITHQEGATQKEMTFAPNQYLNIVAADHRYVRGRLPRYKSN